MGENISTIIGKISIESTLTVETGLHIGDSNDFSAIGAIDTPIVRDTFTKEPYIPGSSLKGKFRFLLARATCKDGMMKDFKDESSYIKRLFGSSAENIVISRLQFFDIYMKPESVDRISKVAKDSYLSEIKFENTIERRTAEAKPRQIERIPRAAEFTFKLTYNIENMDELDEDLKNIVLAIELLEDDYLGGSGTRGYGRVKFKDFKFIGKVYDELLRGQVESKVKEFEKNL